MIHLIYVIVRVEQNIFTTTDHIWVRSFVFDFGTLSSYNYSLSFRPVTCIIVLRVSLYTRLNCFTCIIVPPPGLIVLRVSLYPRANFNVLFYVYHCTPGWIVLRVSLYPRVNFNVLSTTCFFVFHSLFFFLGRENQKKIQRHRHRHEQRRIQTTLVRRDLVTGGTNKVVEQSTIICSHQTGRGQGITTVEPGLILGKT